MPSAVAMTDLGSCRLGNFNFKKLPLGKMPLGKYQTFFFIGHRNFLNVWDLRGDARGRKRHVCVSVPKECVSV